MGETIKQVTAFCAYEVIVQEDGVEETYRRLSDEAWEKLYGQSWESVSFCDELEALFLAFRFDHPGIPLGVVSRLPGKEEISAGAVVTNV